MAEVGPCLAHPSEQAALPRALKLRGRLTCPEGAAETRAGTPATESHRITLLLIGKGPLSMSSDQGGIVTEGSTGPAFIFSCPIPYR